MRLAIGSSEVASAGRLRSRGRCRELDSACCGPKGVGDKRTVRGSLFERMGRSSVSGREVVEGGGD